MAITPPEIVDALKADAEELGTLISLLHDKETAKKLQGLIDTTRLAVDLVGYSLPLDFAQDFSMTHILVRQTVRRWMQQSVRDN